MNKLISLSNSDSTIWNKDNVVIDIAQQMADRVTQINLSVNEEGPCARSLGLYDLLDQLCERFNYSKNKINIKTSNLIEQHGEYNIEIVPQTMYLVAARKYSKEVAWNKQFGAGFKTFGNFIGHGNLPRLHVASYLFNQHKDITCQTYHCNTVDEYHGPFLGIEDLMRAHYSWQEIDRAVALLKQAPITQDKIDSYPILNPATLNITKVYPDFFVEVVGLTYFSGNTFYIDEKIWRPMIMRTPFIVQGPQNFILNLRRLGFKTFDRWWDEGYSEDSERTQLDGIIANIDRLARLSTVELNNMYLDMQSTLEHNYQRLMSIDTTEFLTLCQN